MCACMSEVMFDILVRSDFFLKGTHDFCRWQDGSDVIYSVEKVGSVQETYGAFPLQSKPTPLGSILVYLFHQLCACTLLHETMFTLF